MPTAAVPPRVPAEVRRAILAWFDATGRPLPFRASRDPYAILVSEAMAQQTQAARAGQKWVSFLSRFPTVRSLADASPADVLREWRGLGYNRRALNLWRAARRIVDEHGGRVPDDLAALDALPGVGPYTARAIASFAFGRPVGAVDTNVRRVLGRIVGGGAGVPPRDLQQVADEAASVRPREWTYALMDLGATVCRARDAACDRCPVARVCRFALERGASGGMDAATRGRHPRVEAVPFAATSRWLRGRLLDRLRDAEVGAWVRIDGPLGSHEPAAVETALATMAREGLLERDPGDRARCRLPSR